MAARHPHAAAILAAFIILAVIYSVATPPLEAGDESRHYAVVKYMAETGKLPVQKLGPNDPQIHWEHEGNQPPLYYAMAALLTFWIETGDWHDVFRYNPHTTVGNPLRPDNKNITLHPPGEAWPWRGHVLAIHLIRSFSIALATVTVLVAYLIALRLFAGNRLLAAGAMAVTAFNPMFLFISASVNNDNLVITLVTLALWRMSGETLTPQPPLPGGEGGQRTSLSRGEALTPLPPSPWGRGADDRREEGLATREVALWGLLIGLGALSKLYALGLLPLAGLLLLWRAPSPLRLFTLSLILAGVVLLVAGWFYARNALLYEGDIFALQVMRDTAGMRDEAPSLATLRAEFEGFRIAYWGLFGGVNILAAPWIYRVIDAVSLVALLGLVAFGVARVAGRGNGGTPPAPSAALLLGWCLIMVAGFIAWNLTQPAGQGRLFYPAIAALSALGVLGLTWWLPAWAQKVAVGGVTLGLFLFAALAPFLYIMPAYAKPPRLTRADLPPDLHPTDLLYDGQLRLIGYHLPAEVVRPAEALPLTLYWEVVRRPDLDYSIFVHLLGRQRGVVGQVDTYPGGGHWPATWLAPGDILADQYAVPISPAAEANHAPTRLLVEVGIYDLHEPGLPGRPAVNAAGERVEPIIARLKLIPWQWPTPAPSARPVTFRDKITLLSYDLAPDETTITFTWRADQPLDADYTVFIQVWDATRNDYITGFDGPPRQGDYPTSLWGPGEIIVDTHPLDPAALPPDEHYFLIGLYDPRTGDRLPAADAVGPLPDYALKVERGQE